MRRVVVVVMVVVAVIVVVVVMPVSAVVVRLVGFAGTLGGSVRKAHSHFYRSDRAALHVLDPHGDVVEAQARREALQPFPRSP